MRQKKSFHNCYLVNWISAEGSDLMARPGHRNRTMDTTLRGNFRSDMERPNYFGEFGRNATIPPIMSPVRIKEG
ncbi:hypothetical protein V1283_006028 [Bradyrhizobium sp. AZCC 2262]